MHPLRLKLQKFDRINEIFAIRFEDMKYFTLRVEYTLLEYENKEIEWTLKRLRRSILVAFRSFLAIVYLWIMILWPQFPWLH